MSNVDEGEESSYEESDNDLQIDLPRCMEDLSLKKEGDELSPIALPFVNTDTQHKSADRSYKAMVKLLNPKPTSKPRKSFPKTREQEKNTTIPEKLNEVYLKSLRRNTIMKQNNYMKSDFLEELVIKEELRYLTLEILPQNTCYYLINYERVPADIEGILYSDIQNEELTVSLYNALFKMMSKASVNINDFLFDYHMILNVKKYLSSAANADPVFSCFILLKPTNMLLIKLVKTSNDESNKYPLPNLESVRKESQIFYKLSGPLYLETSPSAKKFVNFLTEHQHRFDPNLLAQNPLKESHNLELNNMVNLPLLYKSASELFSSIQQFNQIVDSPTELNVKISGTGIVCEASWRKIFKDHLEKRPFGLDEEKPSENSLNKDKKKPCDLNEKKTSGKKTSEKKTSEKKPSEKKPPEKKPSEKEPSEKEPFEKPLNKYVLMEVYTLKFSIYADNKTIPAERYISVFLHNDDSFKFCTTVRLFKSYVPRYPDALFMKTGDKSILDRYIFQVVSYLNQTSTCGLHINYINLRRRTYWNLFTGDISQIQARNMQPIFFNCCSQEAIPNRCKKYLSATEYDESANVDTVLRQPIIINGNLTEILVTKPKLPYVLDVYSQINEQKYTKKPEDIEFSASCVLLDGNERTAFEAHKFEKAYRYRYEVKGKKHNEIKNAFYPSLFQTYNCSAHDFLDGHKLVFTDDMKKFLKVCKQGEVRPNYSNFKPERS